MDAYEQVWCGWLAGVVTPELADTLREARELAVATGAEQLAADLLRWEERLTRALALQRHAGNPADHSEVWIG